MPQTRTTRMPPLKSLSHIIGEAKLSEMYRDRSATSDFHWKILKCRMLIFSELSILASPDYREVKRIHVVIENSPKVNQKISALFAKFGLAKQGKQKEVTCEVFQSCLKYTVTARLAPAWNLMGYKYYVSSRDFLSAGGRQQAVECHIYVTESKIEFHLKALKITIIRSHIPVVGDWVRVFPSLNKAIVEDMHEQLPAAAAGSFKCYKDMRRHWKNIEGNLHLDMSKVIRRFYSVRRRTGKETSKVTICVGVTRQHGYRLPDEECGRYYSVRFWRGESLTYPALCVTPAWPVVVPVHSAQEEATITEFLQEIENKFSHIINEPVDFGLVLPSLETPSAVASAQQTLSALNETQAVSLCTPTQVRREPGAAHLSPPPSSLPPPPPQPASIAAPDAFFGASSKPSHKPTAAASNNKKRRYK